MLTYFTKTLVYLTQMTINSCRIEISTMYVRTVDGETICYVSDILKEEGSCIILVTWE